MTRLLLKMVNIFCMQVHTHWISLEKKRLKYVIISITGITSNPPPPHPHPPPPHHHYHPPPAPVYHHISLEECVSILTLSLRHSVVEDNYT